MDYGIIYFLLAVIVWPHLVIFCWLEPSSPRSGILSTGITSAVVINVLLYFTVRALIQDKVEAGLLTLAIYDGAIWIFSTILWFGKHRESIRSDVRRIFRTDRPAVLIALTLSIFLLISGNYLFLNWPTEDGGMQLVDIFASEVSYHLSIVSELNDAIFPRGMDAIAFDRSGYHYFANLFLHLLTTVSGADNPMMVFVVVFVPFLWSLLTINVISMSQRLWGSWIVSIIAVFLTLFVYDTSYFFVWMGSYKPSFWSIWHPLMTKFEYFNNPSLLFSMPIMIWVLLVSYEGSRKTIRFTSLLTVVGWMVLFKAKITSFIIALTGYVGLAVLKAITQKKIQPFLFLAMILIGVLPFYTVSAEYPHNSIVWSHWTFPLQFISRFHLFPTEWVQEIESNGWSNSHLANLSLFLITAGWLAGALGVHVMAFFRIPSLIQNWKEPNSALQMALFTSIACGLVAFLLFANGIKSVSHDTVWFFLTAITLLPVLTAKVIHDWLVRYAWYHPFNLVVGLLILGSAATFVMPSVNHTVRPDRIILSPDEWSALQWLRNQPKGIVVSDNYHLLSSKEDDSKTWVTAYSNQRVISQGSRYIKSFLDSTNLKKIQTSREDIETILETTDTLLFADLMKKWNGNYLYLDCERILPAYSQMHFSRLRNTYSSTAVRIYVFETKDR